MSTETITSPTAETVTPIPAAEPAPTPEAPKEPAHPFDDPSDREARLAHPQGRRGLVSKPAAKDRATKADVPEIQRLTAILRELKPASDADAPRIQTLKKQLREALEIPDPPAKEEPKTAPSPTAAPQPSGPVSEIPPFTEAEPTLDQFADKDDPYGSWVRAVAAYDRRKDDYDRAVKWHQGQQQAHQQAAMHQQQRMAAEWQTRVEAVKAKLPDYDAIVTGKQACALVNAAVLGMDNGPEVVYWLGKNPEILDEINLTSYSIPVDQHSVALLQRRLSTRMTAGTTGATATRPILVAPRPPTPVKTAPMTPSDSSASDDNDDLAAHAAKYGVGSRRRR